LPHSFFKISSQARS